MLKRGTFHGLGPIERAMLSGKSREFIHATATFVLIFLFAITSVDFLIGGGPDFGSPARREAGPVRMVRIDPPAAVAAASAADDSMPTEVSPALASSRAASVLPVSQSFAPPPIRRMRASEAPAEANPASETLADGAAPAAETSAETPRKHVRTKDDPASPA